MEPNRGAVVRAFDRADLLDLYQVRALLEPAAAGIPRAFRQGLWHSAEQRADSLLCHRRLVTAFKTRDVALAEAVMRMHILGAVSLLEEVTTIHG